MSEYIQSSFKGGMNLLSYDTRIQTDQYRVGFNLRNRNDILEAVLSSLEDVAVPPGIKQEMTTFGNYIILFVAGKAYYRLYSATGWKQIMGFGMSPTAERYWTEEVPVATTNYYRVAATATIDTQTFADSAGDITVNQIAGASAGNLPGLLVQDNINQPQFIFIDAFGVPTTRVTQSYSQWSITFTDDTNSTVATNGDKREYVPIGNCMSYVDGILYIVSQDFNFIYRSVSGRPLDFVVNVSNELVTTPWKQVGGGDATTTSYSVGVGGITCIREMSNGSLFVAASNSNFLVSKNMTQNSPKIFGEYTFIRTFLFNATCLSNRVILDSLGDTKFIDLTGVRSFNAILHDQNEGRNSVFTKTIQAAFKDIIQIPLLTSAILYDNYEFYAMQTVYGPSLVVYDTVNGCWTSFDLNQTNGQKIKILSKIELTIQRLFAITEDDKLYTLYIGPTSDTPKVRPISASANLVRNEQGFNVNPKGEIKLIDLRCVFDDIIDDIEVFATPFVNNRLTLTPRTQKNIDYQAPSAISTEPGTSVTEQINNVLFSFPDCGQGWKAFCMIEWSGGSLVQFIYNFNDLTPMSPLLSQSTTQ